MYGGLHSLFTCVSPSGFHCILHVIHIKSFVQILLVSQGSVPKVNDINH